MKLKKRILLTGASGTVGFEVLKQLVLQSDKYELTVFDQKTRNSIKLLSPFEKKLKVVYGDITNPEEVEKVCVEKDHVIHLAAIIPPLADEKPKLAYEVNVNGTKNLILGLKKHSSQAFFMYSSSISVYGDRVNTPWINTSDALSPSPEDHYAVTKIESEQLIRNSGLDFCIFRLAAIMGLNNHKPSGIMFHMPLATAMEILTPEDTARAFVNGIDHRESLVGKTYNLGGGALCRTSYEDFLSRSFKAFGLGKMDFPEHAFAEKNFHCGYYADGDELEELLHFRRDTLEDYFEKLQHSVSPLKRTLASVFSGTVKRQLLKKSEPFHALLHKDKKMVSRFFGILLIFAAQFGYAQQSPLKITVTNINHLEGKIQVSLYNSKASFIKKGKEYKTMIREVKAGTEVFTFNDLPKGEYAVALYHDENSDGKCNTNLLGIPKEGYAFSRNFVPKLSAPKFEDAKFKKEQQTNIVIKMIY